MKALKLVHPLLLPKVIKNSDLFLLQLVNVSSVWIYDPTDKPQQISTGNCGKEGGRGEGRVSGRRGELFGFMPNLSLEMLIIFQLG